MKPQHALRRTSQEDLLVISYLDYPYYSGLSKRIAGITGVLVKNRMKVKTIAPTVRSENTYTPSDHDSYVDIHRIDLRRFRSKNPETFLSKSLQWLLFSLRSSSFVLREFIKNGCLVQYQSVYSAFPALLAKLLLRAKILGDDIVLVHPIIDTLILRMTDIVVTPSPKTCSFAKRLRKTALFVPNGVEGRSCKESDIAPKTFQFRPNMLFVGALSFDQNLKAVENILRLATALQNRNASFEITVVGGPLSYTNAFVNHPMTRRRKVRFVGHVTEDKLHRLYKSSFIGLLPFFQDTPLEGGQRTKALEFFANNLLVISGPNGIAGIDGLKAGKHYLLAESFDQMCELVQECMSEPTKYVKIADAGAEYILENYTWDTLTAPYIALIKNLLLRSKKNIQEQRVSP